MKILDEGKPQIAECECECRFIYNGKDIIYCGVLIEVRR